MLAPGKRVFSSASCRYSGRKSWPHWLMQCASSIAKLETLQARGEIEKSRRQQPLRRDEYKMMPAAGELALDVTNLHLIHPAMKRRRRIAGQAQRIDLILHQRDERRDHDVGASSHRRRHLVAERLPAPGRHHDQRIAPVESGLNGLELQRPQALESPKPPQNRKHFVGRTRTRVARNFRLDHRPVEALHRSLAIISSRSRIISNNTWSSGKRPMRGLAPAGVTHGTKTGAVF